MLVSFQELELSGFALAGDVVSRLNRGQNRKSEKDKSLIRSAGTKWARFHATTGTVRTRRREMCASSFSREIAMKALRDFAGKARNPECMSALPLKAYLS